MKLSKLLLAALAASALLSAFAGSSSARSFSTSSQTFRTLFTRLKFSGAFGNITCGVQVEGSLHSRTIAKVAGSLIGYITAATLLACSEGTATILRETLPWHLRYESFSGTLPVISWIHIIIIGWSWRIREPLATCLGTSTAERPAKIWIIRESGGALTSDEIGGTIPTSCGIEGSFSSERAPVTVLNSTTRITVTLI
jgi:hypothetical protein